MENIEKNLNRNKDNRENKDDIDRNNPRYRDYMMKKAAICKIVAFLSMLLIGAAVSLILPIRPKVSQMEKRKLSEFPDFNIQDFFDGTYFGEIDTWFSDTFPGRDGLMACSEKLNSLYGVRKSVIHGEVVIGDDIPDADIDENQFSYLSDIDEPEESRGESDTVKDYAYSYEEIDAGDVGTSVEGSDGTTTAREGESLGSIYVVGDSAYNYYSFSQTDSDNYVSMINSLADRLNGKANVYSLIIPTSIDITLDDATRNSISSSNQKKAMLYMYSKMNSNVGKCYVYDLLRTHRNEYLYFRTDHHWTALGAYYAYSAFMTQLGKTPAGLDRFDKVEFDNFKGSFYTQTRVSSLGANPDKIIAYIPKSTNELTMINKTYDWTGYNIISDVSTWNPTSKYSTFIGGDNPLTIINNPEIHDGSSVLVIKESFGNAFAPFLVESFENVYVIDYRYYQGTVSELVDQYGIKDVLVLNNIVATSTNTRIDEMNAIMK
ncbi:MAG: DHHW family protein [Lachnospira sp.]